MDKRHMAHAQPMLRLGENDAFRPLQELLDGTRCMKNMNLDTMAEIAGYNHNKIQTRLRDPATLTLGELIDFAGALELHRDDLLHALEPVWQMLEELD